MRAGSDDGGNSTTGGGEATCAFLVREARGSGANAFGETEGLAVDTGPAGGVLLLLVGKPPRDPPGRLPPKPLPEPELPPKLPLPLLDLMGATPLEVALAVPLGAAEVTVGFGEEATDDGATDSTVTPAEGVAVAPAEGLGAPTGRGATLGVGLAGAVTDAESVALARAELDAEGDEEDDAGVGDADAVRGWNKSSATFSVWSRSACGSGT